MGVRARLVVAPMYGYKSIKWLQEIRVTGEVQPGYWEERGYDIDAWVGTPTAEVMHPLSSYVQRFTRAERWIHAVVAALVLVLIVTAAFLYLPFLASLAGQRNIFKWLHVAAGLVLPSRSWWRCSSRQSGSTLGG